MDSSKKEEVLSEIYYDIKNPSSFSSLKKLHASANKEISISVNEVKDWLRKQLTYTLHKQRKKKFKRNKIIVSKLNEQFQADIVDMQEFSKFNSGFKYILTVIDVFSKFAFALPLKSKSAKDVLEAFKKIFEKRKPEKIQTDQGKEFVNSHFKEFTKQNEINFFTSKNQEIKCSI